MNLNLKLRLLLIFASIVISLILLLTQLKKIPFIKSRAAAVATLTASGPSSSVAINSQFTIPITLATDTDIRGVDISLVFDPTRLQLTNISPVAQTTTSFKTFAPTHQEGGNEIFDTTTVIQCANQGCSTRGISAGTIEFGAVTFDANSGIITSPFNGSTILASLTFNVISGCNTSPCTTTIRFNRSTDSEGNNLTNDTNIIAVDNSQNVTDIISGTTDATVTISSSTTPSPTPPSATLTATPTRTPTPSPTRTPTPTPTRTPTPTNIPTATPTQPPISTPTPTTIQTTCICEANNLCSSSCSFSQHNGITYNIPPSCAYDVQSINYVSNPTQNNKNSWCNRPNRTRGDANGDNIADPYGLDYYYWLRAVLGGIVPVSVNADFNGNSFVDSGDRIILIRNLTPTP